MQIEKSGALLVNPALDTVLVESGLVTEGTWHWQIMLSPSADQQIAIEHYAQDGTTKKFDHRMFLNADTPFNFALILHMELNEQVKIREKTTSLTGSICASIVGTS